MNKKKESLKRSKKSLVSLCDTLGEGVLTIKAPWAVLPYEIAKIGYNHVKKFIHDRSKNRLIDFHQKLLEGIPEKDVNDFLKKTFQLEDYYNLLNSILQDEENEKIPIYSKLFYKIVTTNVQKDYKPHFIKITRELRFSDFKLLCLIYINEKIETKAPGNKRNQIKTLTQPKNGIKVYSIQILIRLGLLSPKDGTKPPWPTDLLKDYVELLFGKEEIEKLGTLIE